MISFGSASTGIIMLCWEYEMSRFRVSTQCTAEPGYYPQPLALKPTRINLTTPVLHKNKSSPFCLYLENSKKNWKV